MLKIKVNITDLPSYRLQIIKKSQTEIDSILNDSNKVTSIKIKDESNI
jgi:hypothetical protein